MDNTLPINDHDLLIKLDTKMDGLTQSVNDFHSNLITRVIKVESRLDTMDIYHAAIPLKEYDEAFKWVQRFRANVTLLLGIGGLVIATLGGLIGTYIGKLFGLNK